MLPLGVVVRLAELDVVDDIWIVLVEVDYEDNLVDSALEAAERVALGVNVDRRGGFAEDGDLELPLKPARGNVVLLADLCKDASVLVAKGELGFDGHLED